MLLQVPSIEQYAMRAFASAMDSIPLALAENSGLPPIETLAEIKSRHVTEKNPRLGIDCTGTTDNGMYAGYLLNDCATRFCLDMKRQFIYDPLISKRQQLLLATQVISRCFGYTY